MKKLLIRLFTFWLISIAATVSGTDLISSEHNSYSFLTQNRKIRFSQNADPVNIQQSYTYSELTTAKQIFSNPDSIPIFKLRVKNDSFLDSCIQSARTTVEKTETDSTVTFLFSSTPFFSNIRYSKEYKFHKHNHCIDYSIRLHGDNTRQLLNDKTFQLEISLKETGFKQIFLDNKLLIQKKDTLPVNILENDNWTGVYRKFWTFCVQCKTSALPVSYKRESVILDLKFDKNNKCDCRIYCGPIVIDELKKVDHKLAALIYNQPFFMNWLSGGFLLIFDTLLEIFNNVALSIFLLSICVKIVLAPLFKIASIWQKQVNVQSSILEPRLKEIKKQFKGEEQNRKILQLHKELGISPLYSLKSLLSAAIQIPVFFAAYHMLSTHIALCNSPFLWISDLSAPDHLFKLPFSIPFFGDYFNILPFIMTSFTFASSWLHTDLSLSSELHKKQRNNLFWMALLFFLMLYTSPAGMVVYWTMNNILAFITTIFTTVVLNSKRNKQNHSENKPVHTVNSEIAGK